MNTNTRWITVKDENNNLMPMAVLWPAGKLQKFSQPEINKYMVKGKKQGLKLVEVEIKEIKEL